LQDFGGVIASDQSLSVPPLGLLNKLGMALA
jgi:hypothetical protein